MLKLNGVGKIYRSKGGQYVKALKNINLEIQDSGIVFILGKSGSGKSTLLNILGGIDSATVGEISIDGQSFADFKQSDYDNYRNRYVGFVFQEFNLLNDFDVAGNIALALKLSGETETSDKVLSALQSVGLSADYLTRKIDELSGGEKQRVAIARAIVKDSKLILADEPTGNLDSGTGESIWNILKNLSATKSVVVVTHDRESAERYGDRIIEIADGVIVSDSGAQPKSEAKQRTETRKTKGLSGAVCFKMGLNSLLQRKVKTVSAILLSIFTIFAILLAQVLLSFSSERTFAKLIADNGIEYINLKQGKMRRTGPLDVGGQFGEIGYMSEDTKKYIEVNTACSNNGVIKGKQDILDMGLTFVGEACELDDNSFYMSTRAVDNLYDSIYIEVDGEVVQSDKEIPPPEFFIGKKLSKTGKESEFYTVAGVVDFTAFDSVTLRALGATDIFGFYTENFAGRSIHSSNQNYGVAPDFIIGYGDGNYSQEFSLTSTLAIGGTKVLTEKGLQEPRDVKLADDEIALPYEMYAQLFDANPKNSYVSADVSEIISVPEQLGHSFTFKIYTYDSHEVICDAGELKLAGIAFNANASSVAATWFTAGQKTANTINSALQPSTYLVSVASIDNLQKFLVDFRNKHDGYVSYAGMEYDEKDFAVFYGSNIYVFENGIFLFKVILAVIAAVLTCILILLIMNLVSFSIMDRKKEIGILSALGATNKDITKIFVVETLFISAITFVFNIVAIFVVLAVFNSSYSEGLAITLPLLMVNAFTIVTLAVAAFGLLLLAALIPLRKIIKLKPIDAIKNL